MYLNPDTALEESYSIENGVEVVHQEAIAIRRHSFVVISSIKMAESEQTFLLKWKNDVTCVIPKDTSYSTPIRFSHE